MQFELKFLTDNIQELQELLSKLAGAMTPPVQTLAPTQPPVPSVPSERTQGVPARISPDVTTTKAVPASTPAEDADGDTLPPKAKSVTKAKKSSARREPPPEVLDDDTEELTPAALRTRAGVDHGANPFLKGDRPATDQMAMEDVPVTVDAVRAKLQSILEAEPAEEEKKQIKGEFRRRIAEYAGEGKKLADTTNAQRAALHQWLVDTFPMDDDF